MGIAKGGTTFMHSALSKLAHVRSVTCPAHGVSHKEVHFLSTLPMKQEWVEEYLAAFTPNDEGLLRVDSTPSYLPQSFAACR